jgi:hypothetical protein
VLELWQGHKGITLVDCALAFSSEKRFRTEILKPVASCGSLAWVLLTVLACCPSLPAQSQQAPVVQDPQPTASTGAQTPNQSAGSVNGTIVDATGATVAGARVTLARGDHSANQEAMSEQDGHFSFAGVQPGSFTITITATGFAAQTFSGTLEPGQSFVDAPIALALSPNLTEVRVVVPQAEIAEDEIKAQEKQRVFGVIPNFYVSYIPDAAALDTRQKFELARRSTFDPVTILLTGAVAGLQQAQGQFEEYGQGAQGYAKRFGASYADTITGTFIGSAILPSLLKQDPRYFYKGTGSTRSRILYALANSVICKGDNKRWQPNYSNIAGSFAAGGISNLYYPSDDRGVAFTFENGLIAIGEGAAANLIQEFLVRKLTPNLPKRQTDKS